MNDASWAPDPWLAFAVAVFVLAVLALALFARRDKRPAASTDAKLDAMDRRLEAAEKKWTETDHDVRGIKMIVGNLPTKDNINAIAVQVAESRGKMEGLQTTLHHQTKSLDRIEEFLTKVSADAIVAGQKANNGEKA